MIVLSAFSCPLSAFSDQLSAFSDQLSAISFQLSVTMNRAISEDGAAVLNDH
jgi:hypothetical protein